MVILLALGFHEYSHAKFADMAGDPTPRMMGRVTLNPFNHLDPIGTIFIVLSSISGFGIGWGRPVLVNPMRMRNPRWDHFVSVAAGPVSNLLQAVIYAGFLRALIAAGVLSKMAALEVLFHATRDPLAVFLVTGVMINIGLFVFNMLPIGPLDGHWLVGAFLPEPARTRWYQFNRGIGALVLLFLVFMPAGSSLDVLGRVMRPIMITLFRLVVGL